MSLLQRLEMRQGQALVMTPQLLQAIKLLQLSQLDLAAYVETELERNPLLERAETGPAEGAENAEPYAEPRADLEGSDDSWSAPELDPARGEIDAGFETRLDNVFPDDAPAEARAEGQSGDMLALTP
ncbi:RNA polymerase sigma-54 factor, partial [Methylobacterium hispanicum]